MSGYTNSVKKNLHCRFEHDSTDINVIMLISFLGGVLTFLVAFCFLVRMIGKFALSAIVEKEAPIDIPEINETKNDLVTDILAIQDLHQWNVIKSKIQNIHEEKDYEDKVQLAMLSLGVIPDKEVLFSSILYATELKIHGSKAEVHTCLNNRMGGDVSATIINAVYPGILSRIIPSKIKKSFKKLESTSFGKVLKVIFKIVNMYLDPYKDMTILLTIIGMVGASAAFNLNFFSFYQVQIIWLLGSALFLPLLISSVEIATSFPLAIFGYQASMRNIPKHKLLFIQVCTVLLFPLVPCMLVFSIYEEEENLKKYARKLHLGENEAFYINKIMKVQKFLNCSKQLVLRIKMNELLENGIQLVIEALMLLLCQTKTPTTRGLETVFDSSNEYSSGSESLLYMSLLLSFRKMITTCLKVKKDSFDGFLPSKGACVVAFRSFAVTLVRIQCIILFFTPFLGLNSLLQHWKAEQIPQAQKVSLIDIFRARNKDDTSILPDIDFYTGASLKVGYLIFIVILITYFVLLFFFKMIMRKSSMINSSSRAIKQQVLLAFCLPDLGTDWSNMRCNVSCYQEKRKSHIKEVMCESFFHWIFNMLMLAPIWFTGSFDSLKHISNQL